MTPPSRDWSEFTNDLYQSHLHFQNLQANRQQVELQRQQLNLLRAHQGLPPVPPVIYPDPAVEVIRMLLRLAKWTLVLFAVLLVLQGVGRVIAAVVG